MKLPEQLAKRIFSKKTLELVSAKRAEQRRLQEELMPSRIMIHPKSKEVTIPPIEERLTRIIIIDPEIIRTIKGLKFDTKKLTETINNPNSIESQIEMTLVDAVKPSLEKSTAYFGSPANQKKIIIDGALTKVLMSFEQNEQEKILKALSQMETSAEFPFVESYNYTEFVTKFCKKTGLKTDIEKND